MRLLLFRLLLLPLTAWLIQAAGLARVHEQRIAPARVQVLADAVIERLARRLRAAARALAHRTARRQGLTGQDADNLFAAGKAAC